jgi:hypothetical protein
MEKLENYKNISQLISFHRIGLNMIRETYTNMDIYDGSIAININGTLSTIPLVTLQMDNDNINNIVSKINNFKSSRKYKYLVIYLGVYFTGSYTGHATLLLLQKKTSGIYMERYDPDYSIGMAQNIIDEYMHIISSIVGVYYIPASYSCPMLGPQLSSGDKFGYCQTYVLHYIIDRLMYAFSDQKDIVNNTFAKVKSGVMINELDNLIGSIMNYISKKFNTPNYVLNLLVNFNSLSLENKLYVGDYLESLIK